MLENGQTPSKHLTNTLRKTYFMPILRENANNSQNGFSSLLFSSLLFSSLLLEELYLKI